VEFVTLYRPFRQGQSLPKKAELKPLNGGYALTAELSDGQVQVLLPSDDAVTLTAGDLTTRGKVLIQRRRADGTAGTRLSVCQ
jgi:hypothetical protein